MSADPPDPSPEATRRREADAALDRLNRDNGNFGLPQYGWSAEEPSDDAAERWGRRVGRGLWAVAVIVVLYLLIRLFVVSPA
ncbi:MAG: hypothetical protein P4L98_16310 [Ancalomicrobiaceae bacterium]|nr:hypothetical protein [Ancalomicrobiaceae bacterium]